MFKKKAAKWIPGKGDFFTVSRSVAGDRTSVNTVFVAEEVNDGHVYGDPKFGKPLEGPVLFYTSDHDFFPAENIATAAEDIQRRTIKIPAAANKKKRGK